MEWMAWIPQTSVFFVLIFLSLLGLLVLELRWPTSRRKGLLPLATTRGDRFFISLLATAFFHLLWVGGSELNPWMATTLSPMIFFLVMKWG